MSAVTSEEKAREIADQIVDEFSDWLYDPASTKPGWEGLRTRIAKALADRPVEDGERLREALEPFAKLKPPDAWADHEGINVHSSGWITAGDIRIARAALAASSPNRTEGGK